MLPNLCGLPRWDNLRIGKGVVARAHDALQIGNTALSMLDCKDQRRPTQLGQLASLTMLAVTMNDIA